jgi:ABC-type phosphate transport system substrate-binding protein
MRALRVALILVPLTVASAASFSQSRVATGTPFRVIAHPNNPITSVDRRWLESAFLKKTTRWSNDEAIRAVDLNPDSSVRRRFSEEILGRSVMAIKNYWQQQIFSGRDVPPPELDSDEDVVKYVLKYPGAVGYVSSGADVGGAKTLLVK